MAFARDNDNHFESRTGLPEQFALLQYPNIFGQISTSYIKNLLVQFMDSFYRGGIPEWFHSDAKKLILSGGLEFALEFGPENARGLPKCTARPWWWGSRERNNLSSTCCPGPLWGRVLNVIFCANVRCPYQTRSQRSYIYFCSKLDV
jgi:hypothetical protein